MSADGSHLAKQRAGNMTDRELAGEYAAHTLLRAYGLRLPEADKIVNAERQKRALAQKGGGR